MEILRNMRILSGLTQKEVADRAGISVSGYQNYEKGTRSPSTETLKKIAGAMGLKPSSFLDDQDGIESYGDILEIIYDSLLKNKEIKESIQNESIWLDDNSEKEAQFTDALLELIDFYKSYVNGGITKEMFEKVSDRYIQQLKQYKI